MSDNKQKYDTAEDITITLASLADATSVASSEIDNTSDLYLDYEFRFSIKTNAAGTSATGKVYFYAVGAIDDTGRTYPTDNKSFRSLGQPLTANANATTYTSNTYSLRMAFDSPPSYFKIVVDNQTGAALDATEGNHDKRAIGKWKQVV